jgi:AcrR family transcriptional regulator
VRVNSPDRVGRLPRADGRRNREALLSRAAELIAEQGPAVPLDEIARAAGVGNATLYRHFPDRKALLHAIAMRVIGLTAEAAERAMNEETDSYQALARYLREAVSVRAAWVMPAIAAALDRDDAELAALRARSVAAIARLIANAQRDGTVRPDVTFGDISLLLIRLARPLPPGQDRAGQDATAQRHLAILLAGLRPAAEPLPGPGLTLGDLRAQVQTGTAVAGSIGEAG